MRHIGQRQSGSNFERRVLVLRKGADDVPAAHDPSWTLFEPVCELVMPLHLLPLCSGISGLRFRDRGCASCTNLEADVTACVPFVMGLVVIVSAETPAGITTSRSECSIRE